MNGGINAFGKQLVCQPVSLAVASDDAAHLPEADVVEEVMAGDAYLAHEQLINVVGGNQFFVFLPFPFFGLSSGSPLGIL